MSARKDWKLRFGHEPKSENFLYFCKKISLYLWYFDKCFTNFCRNLKTWIKLWIISIQKAAMKCIFLRESWKYFKLHHCFWINIVKLSIYHLSRVQQYPRNHQFFESLNYGPTDFSKIFFGKYLWEDRKKNTRWEILFCDRFWFFRLQLLSPKSPSVRQSFNSSPSFTLDPLFPQVRESAFIGHIMGIVCSMILHLFPIRSTATSFVLRCFVKKSWWRTFFLSCGISRWRCGCLQVHFIDERVFYFL